MMKFFSKSAIKGNSLNMIANVIVTGEKLNPFSLRLGTKQRCLALSLLYNIILEILAIATKKKNHTYWKETTPKCRQHDCLCRKSQQITK